MPTNSKKSAKATVTSKTTKPQAAPSLRQRIGGWSSKAYVYVVGKSPHQSFRRTKRRDYIRPLVLPNPFSFVYDVTSMFWLHRRVLVPLMLIYLGLYILLVGVASQDAYTDLVDSFQKQATEVGITPGNVFEQASVSLLSIASGGLTGSLSDAQQIFAVLLALLAWLTVVWLLRNKFAGNNVKMRDGLYNAGSPIIATVVVLAIIILQLIPVGVAAIGYAAATTSGLLTMGGAEAMLFWIAAGLLVMLSLYWISSSLFAMIIVTLPGMYPLKAMHASRDILMGRKLKFLLRFIWMAVFIVALWVVVLIPTILFDGWIKSILPAINWLPIVPAMVLVVGTFSVFWASVYVYLLYRKVVDNE